jgi:hypothetical protein
MDYDSNLDPPLLPMREKQRSLLEVGPSLTAPIALSRQPKGELV